MIFFQIYIFYLRYRIFFLLTKVMLYFYLDLAEDINEISHHNKKCIFIQE